jgi:plasmid stability protein
LTVAPKRMHLGSIMNLTVKDIPGRLHKKLKARAEANKRSLNWEVIDILERAVEARPIDIESLVAEAERVRARIKVPPLSEEILRRAETEGRP